jgi:hypothetical protein
MIASQMQLVYLIMLLISKVYKGSKVIWTPIKKGCGAMLKRIIIVAIIIVIGSLSVYFLKSDKVVSDDTAAYNFNSPVTEDFKEAVDINAQANNNITEETEITKQNEDKVLKGNNIKGQQDGIEAQESDNKSVNDISTNSLELKQLGDNDYSVKDIKTGDILALDTPYKDFKTPEEEIEIENNYVGEVYSGELVYKYYLHKYKDFDLYVSNVKYNEKNRNFDEYYISQITLLTNNYETSRGLKIGDAFEKVVDNYGVGQETLFAEKFALKYSENGNEIIFAFDDQKIIEIIIMNIPAN